MCDTVAQQLVLVPHIKTVPGLILDRTGPVRVEFACSPHVYMATLVSPTTKICIIGYPLGPRLSCKRDS